MCPACIYCPLETLITAPVLHASFILMFVLFWLSEAAVIFNWWRHFLKFTCYIYSHVHKVKISGSLTKGKINIITFFSSKNVIISHYVVIQSVPQRKSRTLCFSVPLSLLDLAVKVMCLPFIEFQKESSMSLLWSWWRAKHAWSCQFSPQFPLLSRSDATMTQMLHYPLV